MAPGAAAMMTNEQAAASHAATTGVYAVWRSSNGTDCTRVGPGARCFCDHAFEDHGFATKRAPYPKCMKCTCKGFAFIPQRCARMPANDYIDAKLCTLISRIEPPVLWHALKGQHYGRSNAGCQASCVQQPSRIHITTHVVFFSVFQARGNRRMVAAAAQRL